MKKKNFIVIMVFLVSALFCNLFCLEMKSANKLVALLGKVEAMADGEDDSEKASRPLLSVTLKNGKPDMCCDNTQNDHQCALVTCAEIANEIK